MRQTFVICVVILSVTACLPDRDNHSDPTVAPAAALRVIDLGPGQSCPPVDGIGPSTQYGSVTDVSRGRCLALDATSFDPQGTSENPYGDISRYDFELPATFRFAAVLVTSGQPIILIAHPDEAVPHEYRRSFATDQSIEFKVTVRDSQRNFKAATAVVTFRNTAPTAAIAHGYSVPIGGVPWAAGTPTQVTFDAAASSDEDGDAMRYCWTPAGAPETCTIGLDSFAVDLPLTEGRHLVRLQTKDAEQGDPSTGNSRTSRTAVVANWVEKPSLWAQESQSGGLTFERLDNTSTPQTAPFGQEATFHDSSDLIGMDLIVQQVGTSLRPLRYPDLVAGLDLPLGASFNEFASDPARNRIWVASRTGGSAPYPWTLRVYEATTGPGLTLLGTSPPANFTGSRDVRLEVGGAGEAWLADNIDPDAQILASVVVVSSPGATPEIQDLAGALVVDLGARPSTNEMWILVIDEGRAAFKRFTGVGTPPEHIDLGFVIANAFKWIDENELWLGTIERGFLRVDVNLLLESLAEVPDGDLAVSRATTATVPIVIDFGPIVLDPVTAEVWTRAGRIAPDLSFHPSGGSFIPLLVDPDGYVWKNQATLFRRARSPGSDATIESFELDTMSRNPSVDLTRGSIWVTSGQPPLFTLREVTADGHPGRYVSSLRFGTTESLLPSLTGSHPFSASPTGKHAFALVTDSDGDHVYHYDITTNPAVAEEVQIVASPYDVYDFAGFHASVGVSPPFVWTIVNDASGFYPARISENGVAIDTGVSVGFAQSTSNVVAIARSASDDAACVATVVDELITGTSWRFTLRLYRAVPGQIAQLLEQRIINYTSTTGFDDYKLKGVAASRSPSGGEMCWATYARHDFAQFDDPAQDTFVFGATATTQSIRSFTFTGPRVRSVVPVSSNEVWMTAGLSRIRRDAPNGTGVLVGSQTFFEPLSNGITSSSVLVGAEAMTIE